MNLVLCSNTDADRFLVHGAVLCTQEELDEYYLKHYRIGGEKKGLRRWQDEQGRLTPAGREHYAEMYGWGKKLKKAEKLQKKADEKAERAESAVRRSDEDIVKAYKATQKNGRRTTDRRQRKADQANARAEASKAAAAEANLDARKAQDKATAYADKLGRKDEKLSRYMNEDGTLNEEGLKKYANPGDTPGTHKMSLVGRLKFGKEVSDRVNNQNKMSKEEYAEWEKAENEKFESMRGKDYADLTEDRIESDRFIEGTKAEENKARMDTKIMFDAAGHTEYDDLKPEEQKKIRSDIFKAIKEDHELIAHPRDDIDLEHERDKVYEAAHYSEFLAKRFDSLSPEEQTKASDYILSEIAGRRYNQPENPGERAISGIRNYMQDWLVDRVYDKAGSINAGDYKEGTNASKAQEKADETYRKLHQREEQVKKEIGYDNSKNAGDKYLKEFKRLERALQKDSVWKNLDVQWEKDLNNTIGAILKDLGFSDTPQNRSILYAYGWWD